MNFEETMNTLRYANRAKDIKNKPTINEDPKDAMLRQYQEELAALRQKLLERTGGVGIPGVLEGSIEPVVEDRIIEKVVTVEGVDEEVVKKLQEEKEEEMRRLEKMTEEERKRALEEKVCGDIWWCVVLEEKKEGGGREEG